MLKRRRSGKGQRIQPMLANFERVFLVVSFNQNFNESRIERGLVLAAQCAVEPVVVATKIDTCKEPASFRERLNRIPSLPAVHEIDARNRDSCKSLSSYLTRGETIALLGSSGVGKSTLINTLTETNQEATQAIREQDGKGRHTTVRRTLVQLPSGAIVVDNPGVRELGIVNAENAVASVFSDIVNVGGRCRFHNCQHDVEPNCAVRHALQTGELDQRRFSNYAKLRVEAKPDAPGPLNLNQVAKDAIFG